MAVARIAPEVGGGFITSASGGLVYFELSAVVGGPSWLRPNGRVFYRAAGVDIPKAIWVSHS